MTGTPLCFVTTYPLHRADLGGSGWVDRRLITALIHAGYDVEVVCVTGNAAQWDELGVPCYSTGTVPLEIRQDRRKLATVAASMIFSSNPYLTNKFTVFPGWNDTAALLKQRAHNRIVLTSGWPGLLLAEAANIPVTVHIAHNVESIIAAEHSPLMLKVLGEHWRLARAERRLLSLPHKVFTLSRTDAATLQSWNIAATWLPPVVTPHARLSTGKAVGFIGKASWPPNERALEALLGPVRQELTALGSSIDYVLAGAGTEQYQGIPGVHALGRVAEEKEFYDRTGLVVVPRFGASTGISVKMLEAAEYGLPSVVPTSLANAVDPAGPWLIADNPVDTAKVIQRWHAGTISLDVSGWVAQHNGTATIAALRQVLQPS